MSRQMTEQNQFSTSIPCFQAEKVEHWWISCIFRMTLDVSCLWWQSMILAGRMFGPEAWSPSHFRRWSLKRSYCQRLTGLPFLAIELRSMKVIKSLRESIKPLRFSLKVTFRIVCTLSRLRSAAISQMLLCLVWIPLLSQERMVQSQWKSWWSNDHGKRHWVK